MSAPDTAPDHHTVVVGAGFSGLGAAIKLREAGFEDWVVIEDGDGVGGTWHWNTYPGVAVDIPSFSYQFSFAQRADWSRTYAPGHELKRYAEDLADRYGLRDRIRLSTRVERATWDEDEARWRLDLRGGETITCRYLVNASGVLTTPKLPDIPGVEDFAGTVMHTTRWDDRVDLQGKRIGIIGTGATAVQLIPELAKVADHLTVYQRTPIYVSPKMDGPVPGIVRGAFAKVPLTQKATRLVGTSILELLMVAGVLHFRDLPAANQIGKRVCEGHLRRR